MLCDTYALFLYVSPEVVRSCSHTSAHAHTSVLMLSGRAVIRQRILTFARAAAPSDRARDGIRVRML